MASASSAASSVPFSVLLSLPVLGPSLVLTLDVFSCVVSAWVFEDQCVYMAFWDKDKWQPGRLEWQDRSLTCMQQLDSQHLLLGATVNCFVVLVVHAYLLAFFSARRTLCTMSSRSLTVVP